MRSLGSLGSAGYAHEIAIAALRASCEDVEESSMMRTEVRVPTPNWNALKNMKKINLVPGRGIKLER
jgi:hypothetical protein